MQGHEAGDGCVGEPQKEGVRQGADITRPAKVIGRSVGPFLGAS